MAPKTPKDPFPNRRGKSKMSQMIAWKMIEAGKPVMFVSRDDTAPDGIHRCTVLPIKKRGK